MKRLLLASAMGLVAAGCAPADVQRNTFLQSASESQLEFHKKLLARASSSDGNDESILSRSPTFSRADSGRPHASERGGVSNPVGAIVEVSASATPQRTESADTSDRDATSAETPSGSGESGETNGSSEPGTPGEAAAPEAGSGEVTEGGVSEESAAAPATPTGSGGRPRNVNPSCENSGGRAATCG